VPLTPYLLDLDKPQPAQPAQPARPWIHHFEPVRGRDCLFFK